MDPVNTQLDALGEDHIGFGSRDLFGKPVTIIGARPFTSVSLKATFLTLLECRAGKNVIQSSLKTFTT